MINADIPNQAYVYYFAYGSNMSTQVMEKRMSDAADSEGCYEDLGVWELNGYRFVYNLQYPQGEGHPTYGNIEKDKNGKVYGVLYKITPKQLKYLDSPECEEAPEVYYRAIVKVNRAAQPVFLKEAHVYIGQKKYLADPFPTKNYINKVLLGAKEHDIDPKYIMAILDYKGLLNNTEQKHSFIVDITTPRQD
jgi:cation transport regulator ChaC